MIDSGSLVQPRQKVPLRTLIKKENKIFLITKEILNGAVAKSYMRMGFLIHEELRKYLVILFGGC